MMKWMFSGIGAAIVGTVMAFVLDRGVLNEAMERIHTTSGEGGVSQSGDRNVSQTGGGIVIQTGRGSTINVNGAGRADREGRTGSGVSNGTLSGAGGSPSRDPVYKETIKPLE